MSIVSAHGLKGRSTADHKESIIRFRNPRSSEMKHFDVMELRDSYQLII